MTECRCLRGPYQKADRRQRQRWDRQQRRLRREPGLPPGQMQCLFLFLLLASVHYYYDSVRTRWHLWMLLLVLRLIRPLLLKQWPWMAHRHAQLRLPYAAVSLLQTFFFEIQGVTIQCECFFFSNKKPAGGLQFNFKKIRKTKKYRGVLHAYTPS